LLDLRIAGASKEGACSTVRLHTYWAGVAAGVLCCICTHRPKRTWTGSVFRGSLISLARWTAGPPQTAKQTWGLWRSFAR